VVWPEIEEIDQEDEESERGEAGVEWQRVAIASV